MGADEKGMWSSFFRQRFDAVEPVVTEVAEVPWRWPTVLGVILDVIGWW